MKRFKVTCKECKRNDVVTIDEDRHTIMLFEKQIRTPLLSGRFRKDLNWGWECVCGNYSLLAEEEKADFNNLVSGSPQRIADIAQMLKKPVANRFSMESV